MRAWMMALIGLALGQPVAGWAQPQSPTEAGEEAEVLRVGDEAPELEIEQWVKGEPVEKFEPGRVYAVEFWATWCGPCIAGIPHLTELQKRFREHADFVSVTTADPSNTLEQVSAFVESQGDAMGYRVAFDRDDRTWRSYMEAAGQGGIPCAFIVDKQGVVAWIGHPADDAFERTIGQIIADEFDLGAAREAEAARVRMVERAKRAQDELHRAWGAGEHERALDLADEIVAIDPEHMSQWSWWKFEALVVGIEQPERAYAYVRKLKDGVYKDNADVLLRFAYGIADSLGVENPDTDLALELARRAVELTRGEDYRPLVGLAMVHMRRKEYDEGIAAQERAVDLAPTQAIKHHLQNELEFFRMDKEFDQGG